MTTLAKRLTAFLISGVCVAGATPVHSAGVNLFWNDCSAGGTATTNRTFACNTNSGVNDLYVSFDPPAGVPSVNEIVVALDLQSTSSPLPDWWRFKNAGSCRINALTVLAVAPSSCPDPLLGQGVGGIGAYYVSPDLALAPNRSRAIAAVAVPEGASLLALTPGTEYFALAFRISNTKTIGPTACAGCTDPLCMVLNVVELYQPGGIAGMQLAMPLTNHIVSWQGGIVGNPGCHGATPTLNRTWGQLKSIYR